MNPSLASISPASQATWSNDNSIPLICPDHSEFMSGYCMHRKNSYFDLRSSTNSFSFVLPIPLSEFTIEFWLYSISSQLSYTSIISTSDIVSLSVGNSNYKCQIGGSAVLQGGTITLSTWTHVACAQSTAAISSVTLSNKCKHLLINSLVTSSTTTCETLTNPALNTVTINDPSNPYQGFIADMRIWKKFRSIGTVTRYMYTGVDALAEQDYLLTEFRFMEINNGNIYNTADISQQVVFSSSIWGSPDSQLIICPSLNSFYDSALNTCSLIMKMFKISTTGFETLSLPINYINSIEIFTIKFFIKVLSISNSIKFIRDGHFEINIASGGSMSFKVLNAVDSNEIATSFFTIQTNTWTYVSFAYSYYMQSYQIVVLNVQSLGNIPAESKNTAYTFRSALGGSQLRIEIKSASLYLKELSLWDKYYPEPIAQGTTLAPM